MNNENEEKILEFWRKNKIYRKCLEKRKKGKKFYLCDGPPYPTGEIHPGTAWNKSIKDAILKFKMMQGYNVYCRAGYDTHGLPIELQVEKKLGLKGKKDIEERIGIGKFNQACREWISQYIDVMSQQFMRVGAWMDFDDPYVTYDKEFIDKAWNSFKKAEELNLLKEDNYVIAQCPRCQTSLANYELEYGDSTDPSIYVKFRIEGKENQYLIIWTTTPWTLVSNVAVMVNPMYRYVKMKIVSDGKEEVWILAKDRIDDVQKETGISGIIIEEFAGKELKNINYEHPFADEVPKQKVPHPVVLTDEFVTLEEGTGLVHCAPAHGPEDFIVGQRNELPMFSPVMQNGRYNEDAGKFEGMNVFQANEEIIEILRKKGTLVKEGKIIHRYPHCWRCKTKLIYTPSKQWFITITKIKDKMLEENSKVKWVPDFAGIWFGNFLESAHDWCISRQRYWGIPLPIWRCEKCSSIKVLGSVKELPKKVDPHRPDIDEITFQCQKCKATMYRVPDILDVWFDSGTAIWAGLRENESGMYPSDVITEGKDQIRGWFYSSMGLGTLANGESPYKSVLMHGYVVDEKGMAMHKSLGNYVEFGDVLKRHTMDAFRLWALSNVIWEDLKFNWKELAQAQSDLNILWNIGVYIERFYDSDKARKKGKEYIEDAWLNSKINTIIKECTTDMEKYELHSALRRIRRFMIDDLSRFYLKLIKDREDIQDLYTTYLFLLQISSPFIPFITESLYRKIYSKSEGEESIFMLKWPEADNSKIDPLLEKQIENIKEIGEVANSIRAEAKLKLRWPLAELIISSNSSEVNESVNRLGSILANLVNVKEVKLEQVEIILDENAKKLKEYAKIEELRKKDYAAFLKGRIVIDDEEMDYSKYMVPNKKGYSFRLMPWGAILLKTEMNQALHAEAMLSEVRRRVQMMRKEMQLVESDSINVFIDCSKEMKKILELQIDILKKEVNAKKILFEEGGKLKKKWEIENEKLQLGIG
ncbi:MAG: isoleucine--tRNA ligase [Candidatus Micrarchaeia archaeon]